MHQRSWLAVKPIRKSSPPPATPPMLGRWVSPEKTKKQSNKKDKIKTKSISKKQLSIEKIEVL